MPMNPSAILAFALLSILTGPSAAITLTHPTELKTLAYDYIIVGAGTAGLVLANRLTENPDISVLVLEAGISDEGVLPMQAPFLGPTLAPNAPFDWNYTVTPQTGLNGRSFPYPRGKVLGGSSSINYLIHQFGSKEDWDRYATVSGDDGWSWAKMRRYVQKHERIVLPVDGHDISGQYIPSNHGTKGMVSVTLQGYNTSVDWRVLAAARDLADEFPFNPDLSGGDQPMLGIGYVQSNAGDGKRSSSSSSYLAGANSRPNLTVLIHATVMKLVSTPSDDSNLKAFRNVQFTVSPGSPASSDRTVWTASARKEVILSAGTIGTTQILLLSGIGNKSHLERLNIPVQIDNPNVGENFCDHTFLPNIFRIQNPPGATEVITDSLLADPDAVGSIMGQYIKNRSGMFANSIANKFGFFRLPEDTPILKGVADPAPGPLSPHWEVLFSDFYISPGIPHPGHGTYMTFVLSLLTPTSRGSITLRSNDPFDQPLINPNLLATDFDVAAVREAVKAVKRLAAAPSFADYIMGPHGHAFTAATTDEKIDEYVRGMTTTIFHPTGTASMASEHSSEGVVNPDLRVKGAEGLRIVDASVFPFIPSCHTAGPVYLLAERAADLIKADGSLLHMYEQQV